MAEYIDTHIHLDLLQAAGVQLEEARSIGVAAWVVPGIAAEGWPEMMALTARHAGVYAAPGIHPQAAGSYRPAHLEELRRLLEQPGAVAVGEVGLDRQVKTPAAVQEEVFRQMICLAVETGKPLLIHMRRSTDRVLELLRQQKADRVGGIVHAFSGSRETAGRIVALGFALGIGGVVTFPAARRLAEVVRAAPAEALVLETDAPDLAPQPYCGQLNRPVYLGQIAARVTELRGWSLAETARRTSANARRILGLPPQALAD